MTASTITHPPRDTSDPKTWTRWKQITCASCTLNKDARCIALNNRKIYNVQQAECPRQFPPVVPSTIRERARAIHGAPMSSFYYRHYLGMYFPGLVQATGPTCTTCTACQNMVLPLQYCKNHGEFILDPATSTCYNHAVRAQ